MSNELDAWPGGETWVFQGTVAEDATAGTHVCTLTVTPGAGNEMQLLYGQIQDGNTATSQTMQATIYDALGGNVISTFINVADTAQTRRNFPTLGSGAFTANTPTVLNAVPGIIISGTMVLQLLVSTAAVSVTHTFAVACRIKGAIPTAVLADSVGTPVLTINTNKVF